MKTVAEYMEREVALRMSAHTDPSPPARYVPFIGGRYEVVPGLFKFGRDFGNGEADRHVFQIDRRFDHYLAAKRAARAENLSRYYCSHQLADDVARRVLDFIAERLRVEHANVEFDTPLQTLDDAALLVQEDLAIVSTHPGRHWLSAIHLCFPNHWAAEDKIGRDFAAVHVPVAGIEPVNRNAEMLVQLMVNATDGFVRFAWGIATDDELNHHPTRPRGRAFDAADPRAFVRVERQTIWGFPDVGASVFTIRTYFLDCAAIRRNHVERDALCAAIRSMTPESLDYKGMTAWRDGLLAWLERTDPVR
jgi:dimethylamine monooxygenase subunit A